MSEVLQQLIEQNILVKGIWETTYMTLLSSLFAYVIGLPLGVILVVTDENGVKPNKAINTILGIVVNVFRSIPFLILMVAMLPVAKLVVGTSLGNKAMIVMLVIAAAPYVARMVESSLKEVDSGVIEASKSMGSSTMQIILKVLLPEAKPALIVGAVISTVTVLGYSAMAGTIGAGGLGKIAISFGHQKYKDDVIWVCVILMVLIVQAVQIVGMTIAKKTDRRLVGSKKQRRQRKNV
ncbi:MAG: ABC transporter permease [Clostridia bacterium]|nr:ABC transporter permease [Clostridia bacterium]